MPGLDAPVYVCGDVGSVLDVAMQNRTLLPPWGSVLALSQREGRGQLRRYWHSPPGNLYAALRLPCVSPFSGVGAAPALGALMVAVLRDLPWGVPVDIRLKWPNDVVMLHSGQPRKVGGILLEERGGVLLAGVGINLQGCPPDKELRRHNAMPSACLPGVSLLPSPWSGENVPPLTATVSDFVVSLWCRLVSGVYFWYREKLPHDCSWVALAEATLLWKGAYVVLTDGGQQVHGRLVGIGSSGGVRLALDDRVEEFLSGSLGAAVGTGVPEGLCHE